MDSLLDQSLAVAAGSLAEDFSFLDGWEDRYEHIIALGREMNTHAALADCDCHDGNLVRGCTSRVWMVCQVLEDGHLIFRGSSDSLLVSGLIAILVSLYSHRKPDEILSFDARAFFASIGLDRALTSQRASGLSAMHLRILEYAHRAQDSSEL